MVGPRDTTDQQELVALTVLDTSNAPVGAAKLAIAWREAGLPGAEATAGRFLRQLDQRGLTTIHRGTRGRLLTGQGRARLAELHRRDRQDAQGAAIVRALAVSDIDDLIDLLALRQMIETEACRLAATRATEEEIDRLVAFASAQITAVSDGEESMTPSLNFHRLVAEASHNRLLIAVDLLLLDPSHDPLERLLADIAAETGATLDQASDHVALAAALRDRDPTAAERVMRQHMDKLIRSVEAYRDRGAQTGRTPPLRAGTGSDVQSPSGCG